MLPSESSEPVLPFFYCPEGHADVIIEVYFSGLTDLEDREKHRMKYYTRVVKKFSSGEMIFSENSPCDGMYIIDSGKVRVFKSIQIGKQLKEVELCTLGPKAMFGEMAMIDENKRSASVQAVDNTACTIITKKIFEDQLSKIPLWMVNLIKILVSRLRETNDKLRKIVEEQTAIQINDADILTLEDPSESGEEKVSETKSGAKQSQSQQIIEQIFPG